jgi:hypothetical protein
MRKRGYARTTAISRFMQALRWTLESARVVGLQGWEVGGGTGSWQLLDVRRER